MFLSGTSLCVYIQHADKMIFWTFLVYAEDSVEVVKLGGLGGLFGGGSLAPVCDLVPVCFSFW